MKNKVVYVAIMLVAFLLLASTYAVNAEINADIEVGDIVLFGHYEQDNNGKNGSEEIQWIVLDVNDGKALLLSLYGLDVKQFNEKYVPTTWETSSLRKWMNGAFLYNAFNDEEQARIVLTDVDNSQEQSHPRYQANSGKDTQDKIFALSYAEANKYLGVTYESKDNTAARVAPTPLALYNGAWVKSEFKTKDNEASGRWWLRSPGRHPNRTSYVCHPGYVRDNQTTAGSKLFGYILARPALWVYIE